MPGGWASLGSQEVITARGGGGLAQALTWGHSMALAGPGTSGAFRHQLWGLEPL